MKFLETHFDDYIQSSNKISLHPTLKTVYESFPTDINDLKHVMFYGPAGVGKYTQMLSAIKRYSPSELKYEKKMTVVCNSLNYYFKISDIHFEIDMALLGCNSKLLWNDIYTNIIDVLSARTNKTGIIVCKNFHKIHSELLDSFYSYIQPNNTNVNLIYIVITESVSFIPDNIVNNFHILSIPRPKKLNYNKILGKKLPASYNVDNITNIKNIMTDTVALTANVNSYVDTLYSAIDTPDTLKCVHFRDMIYDIFIYHMEVGRVVFLLLKKIIASRTLAPEIIDAMYLESFQLLQFYNNNYRPIYHLENYLYSLINKIHGF